MNHELLMKLIYAAFTLLLSSFCTPDKSDTKHTALYAGETVTLLAYMLIHVCSMHYLGAVLGLLALIFVFCPVGNYTIGWLLALPWMYRLHKARPDPDRFAVIGHRYRIGCTVCGSILTALYAVFCFLSFRTMPDKALLHDFRIWPAVIFVSVLCLLAHIRKPVLRMVFLKSGDNS